MVVKPLTDADYPWRAKAHQIIGEMSQAAYDAEKRKYPKRKQVRYSVPPLAMELVECLGTNDEERAKAIFVQLVYRGKNDTDV